MKLKTEPTPPKVAPQRIILRGSLSKAEQTAITKARLKCSSIADSLVPAATEQAEPGQRSNSFQLVNKNKKRKPKAADEEHEELETQCTSKGATKAKAKAKSKAKAKAKTKSKAKAKAKASAKTKCRGTMKKPAAEVNQEPQHDNNDDTALEESQPSLQPGSPLSTVRTVECNNRALAGRTGMRLRRCRSKLSSS